jgi:hypothetical protein
MSYLSSSNIIEKTFSRIIRGRFFIRRQRKSFIKEKPSAMAVFSFKRLWQRSYRFESKHGYRFDPKTKRMLLPSELKGRKLPTLTQFEEYKIVD